jgi:hypothetical protein
MSTESSFKEGVSATKDADTPKVFVSSHSHERLLDGFSATLRITSIEL